MEKSQLLVNNFLSTMKNLLKSILLVLFTLAMISQLSQNYRAWLVDLDINAFILQEETIRKEFILVVFEHFDIDFNSSGLEATLSGLSNKAT